MNNRNDTKHDTEDKAWWCHHGLNLERSFVALCPARLGRTAVENPEKATNPYAPDLIVNDRMSDLKVQNTPFFSAGRYGLDPRTTVTFNRKDYERYSSLYPNIDIYFWVDWVKTSWNDKSVKHLAGIYVLPFSEVAKIIVEGAPEHFYIHRRGDESGNAKSSFLLPLARFQCLEGDAQ